jgi:hypothetical protein
MYRGKNRMLQKSCVSNDMSIPLIACSSPGYPSVPTSCAWDNLHCGSPLSVYLDEWWHFLERIQVYTEKRFAVSPLCSKPAKYQRLTLAVSGKKHDLNLIRRPNSTCQHCCTRQREGPIPPNSYLVSISLTVAQTAPTRLGCLMRSAHYSDLWERSGHTLTRVGM